MFGWEFPPHISGGLGTACHGLTKELISFSDIDLTFVVPKVFGDECKRGMKLVGASDVELSSEIITTQMELEKRKFYEFNQIVSAYTTPEQYEKMLSEQKEKLSTLHGNAPTGKIEFSGQYGSSLFEEIYRYGVVATEIARKGNYDIIHAHDWLTYPAGIAAKMVSGKPLVVHVHATEFDRSGENINQSVYEIERRGMNLADKVITVSNLTRNIVITRYGIPKKKVITVHNAVDFSNEPVISNSNRVIPYKVVTFLGRVTFQKGPDYFVEAANMILKKNSNVRFVMAGNGDMLNRMIRYVAKLGISNKFYFTGFLKGSDVNKMFQMSDVYVMPSVSEPFGISPLEAMQSNVPVIISKNSGVSEVLKHALKVDFWDIDAMADAINGVLNYPALAKHLKSNGRHEVENLKWIDVATKVKDIYYLLAYSKAS
ncbi:MAG: glycosyltransferase family 1 protein [Bacteroidales bacterium]|nr:MAG: glycosyltransferase family 1 protein [Bacteroidales bacterium]